MDCRKAKIKIGWIILSVLLISGCFGLLLKGKVTENRYYSPMNNFSIALPGLMEMKIEDQSDYAGGGVTFRGSNGMFWLVNYRKLTDDVASKYGSPDKRDEAYRIYVTDVPLRNAQRFSPNSSIVKDEFIDMHGSRRYFAVLNIPEGSRLVHPVTNRRFDSVRGMLVFEKNGFIYMLGWEMNYVGHPTYASRLTDKQIGEAKETLGRIEDSMIFM